MNAGLLALNSSAVLNRVSINGSDVLYWGPHTNAATSFTRNAASLRGSLTWMTDDAWPTILPYLPA